MQPLECVRLQAAAVPKVDLIINSFTLTGVALMCGEAHGIPVVGFCLQPTCIPSDDKDWHATGPVTTCACTLQTVHMCMHMCMHM